MYPTQRRRSRYASGAKNCIGNMLSMVANGHFARTCFLVYHAGMQTSVILHNIRSAYNVGSIFRTADGAGVSMVYLTGYTPAPFDRFGRVQQEIQKTSLGASETVPYESVPDIYELFSILHDKDVAIVAVEQTKSAVDYRTYVQKKDTAYIFGNEVTGIEEAVLKGVDTHIEVPLVGQKESLNVSVTAGVVLFHVRT